MLHPPGPATFSKAGGNKKLQIATKAGCAWHAVSSASWLRITGETGQGPGMVLYTVEPNNLNRERSAAISVAGQTFTVVQKK